MTYADPTAYYLTHAGYVMRVTCATLNVEADDAIFKFAVHRQTDAGSELVGESVLDVPGRSTVEQIQRIMHRAREHIKACVCNDAPLPPTLDSSVYQ